VALRYLLDSDICIYLMKRKSARLLSRLDRLAPVCAISLVVYGELRFGEASSKHRAAASAHLAALLETIQIAPLTLDVAARYGEIRADLERRGTPIGANDTWIAAHALAADLTLVTNNEREFARVAGLRVENWLVSSSR
jgi:tRNA(fMet)-specific endonuclease VapC